MKQLCNKSSITEILAHKISNNKLIFYQQLFSQMHIILKNWRDFLTREISIFCLVPNMTSMITKQ